MEQENRHPITRTAIVTGAGSGIGLAVTKALVQTGINVVLNGRTGEKLARAAAEIDEPELLAVVAGDITRPESAEQLVASAARRFGRVDILVNNAGIFHAKPFT